MTVIQRDRWMLTRVMAFVVISAAVGCATFNESIQTEGRIAHYATQVVRGIDETLTLVETLVREDLLSHTDAVRAVDALRTGAVEAKRLAEVLDIVDQSRTQADRVDGLDKAQVIIRQIQRAVDDALIPVGSETARVRLQAVLSTITTVLFTLMATGA